MGPKEIMALPTNDRITYSLKVFALAHFLAMEEYTGDPVGLKACELLCYCEQEIARWHQLELR